jgi:hypothetical protein
MVSIGTRKKTLAGQTVYKNGSIDISFDPPMFSLNSTFNEKVKDENDNQNILKLFIFLHAATLKNSCLSLSFSQASLILINIQYLD